MVARKRPQSDRGHQLFMNARIYAGPTAAPGESATKVVARCANAAGFGASGHKKAGPAMWNRPSAAVDVGGGEIVDAFMVS